jgi:7-cyano-7-deazaguanine reductase
MTRIGDGMEDCLNQCKKMIEKDLSSLLKCTVEVNFLENNAKKVEIFENFQNIMDFVDDRTLIIDKFKEAPEVIQVESLNDKKAYYLKFDSLRSNCRVTHQPDFGDVFIYYNSSKHINESSLVKYLSSFRSEFHFHEECCEMIYKRLYDLLDNEDELFVCALYTRRGGIDICPARWSKEVKFDDVPYLADVCVFAKSGLKSC